MSLDDTDQVSSTSSEDRRDYDTDQVSSASSKDRRDWMILIR